MSSTNLHVNITSLANFEVAPSAVTSDSNFCSVFKWSFESLRDSFTYTALSQTTEVFLKQSSKTQVDNNGVVKEETVITSLYEEDPLVCAFGLFNPTYSLTKENFCSQLVTTEFIDEVKKEIEDETNQGSGTFVTELEAELIPYGKTSGKVGKLIVSHLVDKTDTKKLTLELDQSFISVEASDSNLCSLRATQYGDMRSFVSTTAEGGSYGSSIDMVEYFNCITAGTL